MALGAPVSSFKPPKTCSPMMANTSQNSSSSAAMAAKLDRLENSTALILRRLSR